MQQTAGTRRWSPAGCTIISRNYLSFARVLADSFLENHPGSHFYLLVVDGLPPGTVPLRSIRLIETGELGLPDITELSFKYEASELCWAVKPALLRLLLSHYGEDTVIYLDSDILVTRALDELRESLASAPIVVIPHLLEPIPHDDRMPSEQDILLAGAYNLGFLAVRNSEATEKFLAWWEERLREGRLVDRAGCMTDQRWIDLAPGIFPVALLKDETYNVAYWNVHARHLERSGQEFLVNGRPLAFFHFTGFDPTKPEIFSKHQNRIAVEKGGPLEALLELYSNLLMRHGFTRTSAWPYGFGAFDNGVRIHRYFRRIYRDLDPTRKADFGDPFRAAARDSFYRWATRRNPVTGLNPCVEKLLESRPDVAVAFPDICGKDREAFLEWAASFGVVEEGYDPLDVGVLVDMTPAGPPAGPKCSIIIPVHNKASLTRACIDTILGDPPANIEWEIVVADDASTDHTEEVLKSYGDRIRVLRHEVNRGFAASCNGAAAIARGEYLVFLNNDTVPQPGWLDALVEYADLHPEAAMVGSKLLFPDGTIQHAGVVICEDDGEPRHVYEGFPADHPAVNRSRRFQIVTAACCLIRRPDFERAQGFDTAFRNGYEDVDLCLRLGESGREIHYCHESVLYHMESVSRVRSQSKDDPRNVEIYRERWAARAQRDEFLNYVQDGLLRIEHTQLYPIRFSVSPLLATLAGPDHDARVDTLLQSRSRQVLGFLKDNIRLNVRVQEAELAWELRSRPKQATPAAVPRVLARGECRWMSGDPSGRIVSIILPVKNGGAKLRHLLPMLLAQKTRDAVEIVAVDSGSTDDSVEQLKSAGALVLAIDPRSFNHGLTRNLAASFASGGILVFLNQSTLPADEHWLGNLVAPFDRDPLLAGVCGRVLPRQDADLLAVRDIARNINASTRRVATKIEDFDAYRALSPEKLRSFVNFHTLSAAIRADVFRQIPFREANFAEDLIWGKEALEAGFRIQFEPTSLVFHSHNYSVLDIFRRNFDDGAALRRIVGMELAEHNVAPTIQHLVRDDWRYLEHECRLPPGEAEQWRLAFPMLRAAQVIGLWLGMNSDGEPDGLARLLSLTAHIKSGGKTESPESWSVALCE